MMKSFGMTVISLTLCVGAILMCDSKMGQMLSLLESSTRKIPTINQQLPTNDCSLVTANFERNDDPMNYKEALEMLRGEQTSWLAVIGFFGIIFGLIMPIGSYLLQRQSLKDERAGVREDLKDSQERNEKSIAEKMSEMNSRFDERMSKRDRMYDDLRRHDKRIKIGESKIEELSRLTSGQVDPYWIALGRIFERAVLQDSMALEREYDRSKDDESRPGLVGACADVQLGLEHCFDVYVHAGRTKDIKRIVKMMDSAFQRTKILRSDLWETACDLNLRNQKMQLLRLSEWSEYERLLQAEAEVLKWINARYAEFAPIKLRNQAV